MVNHLEISFDRKFQVNLINFLLNFAIMGSIIFIPLLSSDFGASELEVGIVGAAYGIAYLGSSLFFGWKSDTLGRLIFIRSGLGTSSLAFLAQTLAHNLPALILIRASVGFCLGISTAALTAYVYESKLSIGKFSSWGSLGWIFSALAAAILKEYNYLFTLSAVLSMTAFLITFKMSDTPKQENTKAPYLPTVISRNFGVYFTVFLRHLGAAAVWIIMPLYWASLGANKFWIGILWGINFIVQFITMPYVERFPEKKIFDLGLILSVVVFLGYGFATHYTQIIFIQAVLGLSWSFLFVGALLIILKGGEERGTASGIFHSTFNFCNATGPFLGGLIAYFWGFRAVMFFAAALGLASFLVALPVKEKKPLSQAHH